MFEANDGRMVPAWIEPTAPWFRWPTRELVDTGSLVIDERAVDPSDGSTGILTSVGRRKVQRDFEIYRSITAFGAVYEDPRFGRLYAKPIAGGVGASTVNLALLLPSASKGAGRFTLIHGHAELTSYCMSAQAADPRSLFGTTWLVAAQRAGHADADRLREAIQRYEALVDWRGGPGGIASQDLARIASAAKRPRFEQLATNHVERTRWYMADGQARLEPLSREQLSIVFPGQVREPESAAVPASEWAWFRRRMLGSLEEPVTLLHDLLAHIDASLPTAVAARETADWCCNGCPPPHVLAAALRDLLKVPELRSNSLGELLGRAMEAVRNLETDCPLSAAPALGSAMASSNNKNAELAIRSATARPFPKILAQAGYSR